LQSGGGVQLPGRRHPHLWDLMHSKLYRSLALLLSPALALIGVFVIVPTLLTIWLAFQSWSTQTGFETAKFVGVDNFLAIFGPTSVGRDFKTALANTAIYTGLSVVIILPLSVGLGLLVHQQRVRGGIALRTILFSTYMVPMIAVALVFSKLYSPTEGPLNQILGWIGVPPQTWLSAPQTSLVSIVLLNVWQQVGYFVVLAVAGLTQIPATLYEAAEIDGANPLQRFVTLTLPLLANTLLFSAVIAVINAVQVFEPVALITQGGPANSTNVLTYHIRRVGIERAQGGVGSAMAVTLMLALIVSIVAIFAFFKSREVRA
jgi:multiple sugar transport system permease protein